MKDIKRIIVVDLLYLGDLLFAHPFFNRLRKIFPESRIDLIANSNFAEIMRVNENIDHVYSYNKNCSISRSYSFAKKMKMNNYQLGINIHGNWRTALLLKLISPQKTIGYGSKGRGLFLDEKVNDNISSHMIEHYLKFIDQLSKSELLKDYFENNSHKIDFQNFDLDNKDEQNSVPFLKVEADDKKSAAKKLEAINLETDFIVLNSGGSWKTKRWPEKYFAEIADLLAAKGKKILFVGGPSDKKRAARIFKEIKNKETVYNLTGKTSLLELAAILKKAELMISGDTGPVHIAAAVGTDTMTIFGPSDEKLYAPRGRAKNILIKNVDLNCRPCGEHECPLKHFKCMRELKPKMLVQRLEDEGMIR